MMDAEVAKNAKDFRDALATSLAGNITAVIDKNTDKIDEAYARLTSLQAIKIGLLNGSASDGALGFFTEAQGDGLTSQVLILSGSTRSALKSLRSLIENIIRSIYYADHPIEYRLWEKGKHRPTFKSLLEYIESHPDVMSNALSVGAAIALYANWKKLSQSVHASAKEERMSGDIDKITIWKTSQRHVGAWNTFQKNVIKDVGLLYIVLYASKIQGAGLKTVREALSLCVPAKLDAKILSTLEVKLPRS